MTEEEFRKKYPHSTDEQVRLYGEAVAAAETAAAVQPEPDIPMPMITVPVPVTTTYAVPANRFQIKNFSLDDVPPEVPPASIGDDLRDILLGTYGFSASLSPEQRLRLQTTDMSEDDMLAMLIGAPNAQEFRELNR